MELVEEVLGSDDSCSKRVGLGLETCFKFSLSLLRQVSSIKPDMVVESLEYLLESLQSSEGMSLWDTDKLGFMLDANLSDAREFLLEILEKEDSPERAKELVIKIIFKLGIARGNAEDLLLVATLIDRHQFEFDLREEINQFEQAALSAHLDSGDKSGPPDLKFSLGSAFPCFYLTKLKEGHHLVKTHSGFASDGKYSYLHLKNHGLFKISEGAGNIKAGNILKTNPAV